MENIKINTTQNVSLSYAPAGVGQRMLSIMLDTFIRYGYFFIIFLIAQATVFKHWYSSGFRQDTSNQLMIGLLILLMLPGMLYHLLCETFLNGQSFGKKLIKLKVVKLDGTQPNFGSYLIRSIFRIMDDGLIGIIAIAASQKAQRLGDMVAGTTVIELNKRVTLSDTILNTQKPDYKIVYQQIALFTDADASTIKEVLDFATKQEKPEHLKLLADKIKLKYGIFAASQQDEDFLRTLLMDYSHYQFEK